MRVSMEVLSDLERRLTISVPSQEFERKVSDKLRSTKNSIRLPGFRPGKVPLKEVRRRYGRAVRVDVAQELMQTCYGESVVEERLWPAGPPQLELLNMDSGADFAFTASLEILPDVELADFSTFKILRPEAEITDADVDAMLESLRTQHRTWQRVERPAEAGDRVELACDSQLDGESFENGQTMTFVLGENGLPAAFDEAATGMAAGELKGFDAAFPNEHPNERIRGRTLSFVATLKEVQAPQLPDLDEAFFQVMGVDEGGLEAFREEVTANMRRELDGKIRSQAKQQVMRALWESHQVPLPKALVHQEMHASKDRLVARLKLSEERAAELSDDLFQEDAERAVALQLINRQIVRRYNLQADKASIRAEVERVAEVYAEPDMVMRSVYQDESRLATFERMVIENKVVETVLGQAQVEARPTTYEAIVTDRALPTPNDSEAAEQAPGAADAGEPEEAADGAAQPRRTK